MFKRIYLEITNCCNLHCSFCPGTTRETSFMSLEHFTDCVEKIRPYTNYLYLHVLGEPLLHPEFSKLLSVASEKGFRLCITTNGTLLDRQKEILLSMPSIHKVSISLHCYEANHLDIPLECYLDSVWSFATKAASQGILCALRLWNEGGANEENARIISYLTQKSGIQIDALTCDARGNKTILPHLFLESAEKFDWPSLQASPSGTQYCHGLRQQLAILCDGTVVPCCLDGEGSIPLGNLFTDSMEDILASPRVKAIREGFQNRHPSEELCRRCGYAARFNI